LNWSLNFVDSLFADAAVAAVWLPLLLLSVFLISITVAAGVAL
jgi:hypothetical protein